MVAGLRMPLRGRLRASAAGMTLMVLYSIQSGAVAAADDEELVQSLLQKLEEREATILDLVNRVQQLEQRLDAAAPAPGGVAAPAGATVAASGAAAASGSTAEAGTSLEAPASTQTPSAADDTGAPAAPGTFAVDPEAAERALERTLVQVGALLLPFGDIEVEPGFTYSRQETTEPILLEGDDFFQVDSLDVRENDLTGSLDLRFGLPWTSQFEIGIPFVYNDQSQVFANTEESTNAFGLGDISVGLAKELVRERGWRPDLLARVTWDADTGQEKDGLELGNGFHGITGSLTALKRQDPLAFFANGFYRKNFEKDNVDPGDEFGFVVGTVLAASPDTSLSLSLQQTFSKEQRIGGSSVPGSDEVSSVFVAGASSVLGRGVLLSLNAGVGLTDDAPDYFVGVSLPIRFNLPVQ